MISSSGWVNWYEMKIQWFNRIFISSLLTQPEGDIISTDHYNAVHKQLSDIYSVSGY
jgi:hypothetical protein